MSVYTHAVHPDEEQKYEPQVILVGTFAKEGGTRISEEKVASKLNDLKQRIKLRPYERQIVWPIQLFDNCYAEVKEVNDMQHHIDEIISKSDYMKVDFPIKWNTFLCVIEDSDRNIITVEEARSKMDSWDIKDEEEQDELLQFFHDTGHIIYHLGCELIVLKPQYLNDIISNIITVIDDEKMRSSLGKQYEELKENGILHIAIINAVLEETKVKHAHLDGIIDMMKKFDLICEIPGEENMEKRRFFVPCRSSPTLDEIQQFTRDDEIEFVIDFNHFLPDGFLHRLYVRMAKWSMERGTSHTPIFHCRQMVFYIDSDHRVEMTNEIHHEECNQIKVTMYTIAPDNDLDERPKAMVSLNEDVINHLHETLDDLKRLWARRIEYSVGILCTRCTRYGKKGLIPMRRILGENKEIATCVNLCAINVGRILKAFNKHPQDSRSKSTSGRELFHDCCRDNCESRGITDDMLDKLAKEIPSSKYHDFCRKLEYSYDRAQSILDKNKNDYEKATRECLAGWNNRAAMSLSDLHNVLFSAGLVGKIDHIR
ncbi:uncharacterized protein LOC121417254 [Lytechinus variegatus]|uniref:uncharacterized protein LOC121417254 n=1 Tax=Lytechinus variegatus TaxID=7654 RepID=UPI001BB216F9|nr:uncharacterized protein LOC121417254 [Lytechinus variegatus]